MTSTSQRKASILHVRKLPNDDHLAPTCIHSPALSKLEAGVSHADVHLYCTHREGGTHSILYPAHIWSQQGCSPSFAGDVGTGAC